MDIKRRSHWLNSKIIYLYSSVKARLRVWYFQANSYLLHFPLCIFDFDFLCLNFKFSFLTVFTFIFIFIFSTNENVYAESKSTYMMESIRSYPYLAFIHQIDCLGYFIWSCSWEEAYRKVYDRCYGWLCNLKMLIFEII